MLADNFFLKLITISFILIIIFLFILKHFEKRQRRFWFANTERNEQNISIGV